MLAGYGDAQASVRAEAQLVAMGQLRVRHAEQLPRDGINEAGEVRHVSGLGKVSQSFADGAVLRAVAGPG